MESASNPESADTNTVQIEMQERKDEDGLP
jgi:hypothetical protein